MTRHPAFAGQFYPADPQALKKSILSLAPQQAAKRERAVACVLPHAGYTYSGKVAATTLSQIDLGDACILLGPNHTGYGTPASIMTEGEWLTPLGPVSIDREIATALIKECAYLEDDELAHTYEHSLEVQLPLIQVLHNQSFTFVPITLATNDDLVYKKIADAIATVIRASKKSITIIASSDMTHYETQPQANKKDEEAIRSILALKPEELLAKVEKQNITMCGAIPTAVAIMSAKKLGATKARLAAYQTSGDVTEDFTSVVGYAGIIIT